MSFARFVALVVVAVLEGALVALPRADALDHLSRLRSPAWALSLPGSILVGTFGPLVLRSMAFALVVLAAVATPLLAAIAILGVVRGPRAALLLLALALTVLAGLASGWLAELSGSLLTALGCLALGASLVRLIPGRWVLLGVLCMSVADAALLACGIGQPAQALIAGATVNFHGPVFDQATIGPVAIDYPDLVLAAVLGGFVAGQHGQRRAAALVAMLVTACGALMPPGSMWPATVPIALTFILLRWRGLPRPRQPISLAAPVSAAQRALV